jgi:predicted DNA-binding transcriptional regulator AlpA
MQANSTFPKSISIGARAIAWSNLDIDEWINSRIALTNKSTHAGVDL